MASPLAKEFESRFPVCLTQSVIWGDMDAFQHINNTVYFRYFENVRIEYFERTGINAFMKQTKIGPILGSTECRYLAPIVFPDDIILATQVIALKEKRFSMVYEIFSKKQAKLVAKGTGEIIYFDYNKNETCVIPETIKNKISELSLSTS